MVFHCREHESGSFRDNWQLEHMTLVLYVQKFKIWEKNPLVFYKNVVYIYLNYNKMLCVVKISSWGRKKNLEKSI